MKKRLQSRFGWSFLAIAALAASASGCKSSGFSMPGKNLFSWNRQPNATTLAGNSKVPNLPESPAAKYDPAAIASTTGKASGTPAGSAYGYGATGSGATQPGLAASANGYQTGPYPLASNSAPPATSAASTATTGSLPSPYGGSYSGSSASLNTASTAAPKSDVPLPNSVAAALGKGPAATAGYTSAPSLGSGLPAFPNSAGSPPLLGATAPPTSYGSAPGIPATTSAYQLPPGPNASGVPAFTASNTYTSPPVSTAGTAAGVPALPAIGVAATQPTTPSHATSPALPPSGGSAASSAYQSSNTLSPYSPGSTGRSTTYDFSGGQKTATPANAAPLLR